MRDYLEYKRFLASGIPPFEGAYLTWPAKWVLTTHYIGQVYEAFELFYGITGGGVGKALERHQKSREHIAISQETIDFVLALEKLEAQHEQARLNP